MIAGQCQVFVRSLAVAFQNVLHLLVSKAAVRTDHRVSQVPRKHFALFVHAENGRISQFFLVGAERTDKVAQAFGQHGNGAVNQVNARGAAFSLLVDDVAFLHIVRHVGNVYTDFPHRFVNLSNRQCIVEVLGVVRVDGKGRYVAEVLASGNFLGRDVGRECLGRLFHLFGIFVGQSVLRQYGVHFGIVLALFTQNVHYLANGAFRIGGPFGYFHHHLVAVLCPLEFVLRNKNVGSQRAAFGDEETIAALHLQLSDEGVVRAFQNFGHLGLTCMSRAACQHGHAHAVAVECMKRISLTHQNTLSAVVGQEEFRPLRFRTKVPSITFERTAFL